MIPPTGPGRRGVVLDTDLGSDVDDALALALLLGSPEVDLVGVTTVYGDTDLRARATSRLLALAGVAGPGAPGGLPVLAGAREPLSGAQVWWAGHEGTLLGDLATAATTPVAAPTDAADWLAARSAAARATGAPLDLLAVGPLTGVALALRRHPDLAGDLRSLVVMGGRWDGARDRDGEPEAEHNLRSDVTAAREVLTSGVPTLVVGLEVTRQVRLTAADVERIAAAGALGGALAAQVRQWWELWEEPWGVPHDPVTALLLCEPELLRLGPPGTVVVAASGAVRHLADPAGSVRVATGVDAAGAAAAVVRRVLAGCSLAPAAATPARPAPSGASPSGASPSGALPSGPQTGERRDLRLLPKASLHVHLEGCMRPSTLAELAGRHGVPVPATRGYGSFTAFAGLYEAATEVVRSENDLRRVVREVVEDAAADGAVWVEPAMWPSFYDPRLGSAGYVLDVALDEGLATAARLGIGFGLMVTAIRVLPAEDAEALAVLAASRRDAGVVSFGLAHDEALGPPAPFARAFALARAGGLVSAPHAGEHAGPDSVRSALDDLGARRLGHGVRAVEDPALVERLAAERVCLDVCPTSNRALGVVASLAEHPLPRLLAAGVPCSLGPDDSLLFGPGLLQEYETARSELRLDDAALAQVARSGLEAAAHAPGALVSRALEGVATWLT